MLAAGTTHTTEPDVVVPVLGPVPVPVRGAQVPGLVVEGAAAEHPPPVVLPADRDHEAFKRFCQPPIWRPMASTNLIPCMN
jgi:hypothetical protein